MQTDIINLANEAIRINTHLFNKSVEYSVESAQQFVQDANDRASEWLKIKDFDDFAKTQESWNVSAINRAQKVTRAAAELGSEAYASYFGLWKKIAGSVYETPVKTTTVKKAV